MSYSDYEKTVLNTLWTWANQHHQGELDGGKRQRRPPVLASGSALNNVLVLPNGSKADNIRTAIPRNQRHRWFRSLKSSQALTQSVFGAIQAFDRLDLFQNVSAECGRPAFFDNYQGWTLDFEHEVRCLKEPRPTSVDVLLSGPNGESPSSASSWSATSGPARARACLLTTINTVTVAIKSHVHANAGAVAH